jgi:hypothetical protein
MDFANSCACTARVLRSFSEAGKPPVRSLGAKWWTQVFYFSRPEFIEGEQVCVGMCETGEDFKNQDA